MAFQTIVNLIEHQTLLRFLSFHSLSPSSDSLRLRLVILDFPEMLTRIFVSTLKFETTYFIVQQVLRRWGDFLYLVGHFSGVVSIGGRRSTKLAGQMVYGCTQ